MGFVTDALGLSTRDPQQANIQVTQPLDPTGKRIQLDETNYNNALEAAIRGSATAGGGPEYEQLTKALVAQAQGQGGPSVAETMLGRSLDKNIGAAASLAASQRGINPAMASRIAMNAQQRAMTDTSGQVASLRAQEQLAAQNQLGGVLAQRGQLAGQNLSTLGNLSNAYNQLQLQNALGAQGMALENQRFNAGMAWENQKQRSEQIGKIMESLGAGASQMSKGGKGGPGAGAAGAAGGGAGAGAATPMVPIPLASGGMIPGDHPQNDIVPAMLSPGEIVLPRSVTQAPDAAKRAMAFVEAIKNSKGKK